MRKNAKDEILDAAEAVVLRTGVMSLTLEAVAERAGVSKGGLLYHFPAKEALLKAMVARQLERFETDRQTVRNGLDVEKNAALRAHVQAATDAQASKQPLCAALLAAAANNPDLLSPVKPFLKKTVKQLEESEMGFDRAAVLWLATEGLWFLEMLQVSPLTAGQRKRIAVVLGDLAKAWT